MEGRKEGKLSRWRVFGLKQNPWTQLTLGLQLGRQGEEPAKDKKIQGLTLDLDVLTLDSGQSAFFCAHLQHPRLSVCRSVYQNPTFFIFEPQPGQAISLCCVPQLILWYFNDELLVLLNLGDIEPSIPGAPVLLILLSIILLIYIFSKMNNPNIAARETGDGNSREMAKLIPDDIPIHSSWLRMNCYWYSILFAST
jgi:hypothetical protein